MILGIDTATEWVHLALVDATVAWTRRVLTAHDNTASAVLLPSVGELLSEAKAERGDISGIVTSVGPGGFTSLRVGIATAEGFGVLGLPTWGFSAFELRARALPSRGHHGTVYVILDGQRREAFLQPWDLDKMLAIEPATKISMAELSSVIRDSHWWTPERFHPLVASHIRSQHLTLENEGEATLNALTELCRICPGRPVENPLAPFYLRETDAEVNFPAASGHLEDAHRQGLAR